MSTINFKHALFAFAFLFGMTGICCTPKNTSNADKLSITTPPKVGDGWQTASLKEADIDSVKLLNLLRRIDEKEYPGINGILIVKDGKLVFEKYFPGYDFQYTAKDFRGRLIDYDGNTIHNLASVTKSVTALLCGIAIDKKFIRGVEDKLYSYFSEDSTLFTDGKKNITLSHLLTMSSGLQWNEQNIPYSNRTNDIIQLFIVNYPLQYILSKPLENEPGTKWYYNGGGTNVIGQIIQRTSDTRLDYFADKYLFDPLEIKDSKWVYINRDFVYCSGDLRLRPRDMAKLGQLVLEKGVWKGRRIVSSGWIEQMTGKHVTMPNGEGYGYQWWLQKYKLCSKSVDSHQAAGWGGQKIIVLPELRSVVVITGDNYTRRDPANDMMYNYILPSIDKDFRCDFAAIEREAPLPDSIKIIKPRGAGAAHIAALSGHWCGQWEGNVLSCQLVAEKIDSNEATVLYSWADHPSGYFKKGWTRKDVDVDSSGRFSVILGDTLNFRIDPSEDVVIGNMKNKYVAIKLVMRRME